MVRRAIKVSSAKPRVSAADVSRRLQTTEALLRQGWPEERIIEALRTSFNIGPKGTRRLIERVRAKWAVEAAVPLGVAQQREIGQIDEMIRKLHTEVDAATGAAREIRDPSRLDAKAITNLMALRAHLSGSPLAARTASPSGHSDAYLGGVPLEGADLPELQGDQGDDEEDDDAGHG
jgi:hypothetical protein